MIKIKDHCGKEVSFDGPLTTTIGELKRWFADPANATSSSSCPPDLMSRMFFMCKLPTRNGTEGEAGDVRKCVRMEDGTTLEEYGVALGDCLFLFPKLKDAMEREGVDVLIRVAESPQSSALGTDLLHLRIHPYSAVKWIKECIAKREGVPEEQQRLSYLDQELNDEQSPVKYGILNEFDQRQRRASESEGGEVVSYELLLDNPTDQAWAPSPTIQVTAMTLDRTAVLDMHRHASIAELRVAARGGLGLGEDVNLRMVLGSACLEDGAGCTLSRANVLDGAVVFCMRR